MSEFSTEEFADSVRAAIGTVNHLCIQVDRLNASLRDALTSEPDALTVVSRLGSSQGKRRHDFRVVRFDHGVLFHADPVDGDEDLDDEEDLDEELETGDDAGPSRRKKRVVELSPDQPLLAVRTLLYDHKKPDDLEPQILYAVLGNWRVGDKPSKSKSGDLLRLKYHMANRILRALDHRTTVSSGNRLRTKAIVIGKGRSGPRNPERELSAQLLGPIKSVRLYDLDGSGAVEQLATDIKAHWLLHTSPEAP